MASKFEIVGQHLIVTDTVSGKIQFQAPRGNSFFNSYELEDSGDIQLFDNSYVGVGNQKFVKIELAKAEDENGTPFSATTFRQFMADNTGFDLALDSAGAESVDAGISFDALGATEVSQLTTLLDIKQSGGFPAEFIDFVEVSGGSHTYDSTTGSVAMSVSSNGDRVVAQDFQRTNYQTGKPKQTKQTIFNFDAEAGVGKRFGYFSADYGTPYTNNLDGFWLENDTTDGLTLNIYRYGTEIIRKDETEWVGDDYDWSSVDWSKNILSINEFVWLGVDQVQFRVKIGNQVLVLHTEYFTNVSLQGVYMRHANQPMRREIWSTGGSGQMNYICSTAEKKGSLNTLGKIKGVDRGVTHQNVQNSNNIYANIGIALDETKPLSFRNTIVDIIGGTFLARTNDDFLWRIYLNPTISGTALSWNSVTNSGVKYFVGADNNYVTGGTIIQSGYVIGNGSDKIEVDSSIKLGVDLDGNPDVFVLAIYTITNNLDVLGSIYFREQD